MATENKAQGLAKRADVSLAVMDPANADIMDLMREELGDDAALGARIFTKVKMPSAGGITFTIANDDDPGNPDVAKTIEGVIVAHHKANAYYSKPYESDGDADAPDCSSPDGKTGHGIRFASDGEGGEHDCGTCPLNEFGSSPTGGKACGNRRNLYILREGDIFPCKLSLPPTSLSKWDNYVATRIKQRQRVSAIVTRIGLADGKATFAFVGALDPEAAAFCETYGKSLKATVTEYVPPIVTADATPAAAKSGTEPF